MPWTGSAFQFSDSGSGAVDILARSPITLSHSRLVTEDELNRRVQGLSIKESVVGLVSVANATLTEAYMQNVANFTGYSDGQRIIVRTADGVASEYNGIFEIQGGLPVRPTDAIDYQTIEGAYVYVSGATGAAETDEGTGWVLNVTDDSLLSDAVAWDNANGSQSGYTPYTIEVKQFHGQGTITVGDGLVITGNLITLDVLDLPEVDKTGVVFGADATSNTLIMADLGDGNGPKSVNFNALLDSHGRAIDKLGTTNNRITINNGSIQMTIEDDFNGDTNLSTANFLNMTKSAITLGSNVERKAESGHDVNILAGTSSEGAGGTVTITAGSTSTGGVSGSVTDNGGDIVLQPGTAGPGTTGLPGRVSIEGNYVQIPSSTLALSETAGESDYPIEGGMRIRKVAAGVDYIEIYDTNSKKWVKVGGGTSIKDLDGDTSINVASSDAADEDYIKMNVFGREVVSITTDTNPRIDIKAADAYTESEATGAGKPALASVAADVNITSGNGIVDTGIKAAGNMTLSLGTPVGDAGTGVMTLDGKGGVINITAGTSAFNTQKTVNVTGDIIDIDAGTTLSLGKSTTDLIELGTAALDTLSIRGTIINAAAGDEYNIYGDGTGVNIYADGAGGSIVLRTASDGSINIGTTDTQAVEIGNSTGTNIITSTTKTSEVSQNGSSVLVKQDDGTGVTVQADDTTNTHSTTLNVTHNEAIKAKLDGSAEDYSQKVREVVASGDTSVVPNVQYIKEAVQNAELGGIGVRSLTIEHDGGPTGTNIPFGVDLPANARVRRVTIDVEEAFDANVQDLRVHAASGGNITAVTDIDLSVAETYIIEPNGRTAFGGAINAIFDAAVESSTTGIVHITFEFSV